MGSWTSCGRERRSTHLERKQLPSRLSFKIKNFLPSLSDNEHLNIFLKGVAGDMLEGGSGNRIQHFVSPVFLLKITRQSLQSRRRSPLYSQQHPYLRKMKNPRFGKRETVLLQQKASYLVGIYHLSKGAEGFM